MSSKKGPCHTTGFSFVSDEADVVVDPGWEAKPLPMWETNLLLGDGGWNTSLAKRDC